MRIRNRSAYFIVVTLLFVLTACGNVTPDTPTQVDVSPTAIPETQTPTQIPVPDVILWLPEGADVQLSGDIQTQLSYLAGNDGLLLETQTALSISDLKQGVEIVVALAPAPDLMAMVNTAPQVKFLAIGISDLEAGKNLSIMPGVDALVENTAFLAGYLSALVTTDYRVGVLVQSASESGTKTANSFAIGARYYCGLCGSKFGPIDSYPKMAEIADASNEGGWKTAADALIAKSVQTVYIEKAVSSEALVVYLSDAGVRIISADSPPTGIQSINWIATLKPDFGTTLLYAWPALMAGGEGGMIMPEIILTDTSPGLISEGRMALFEETRSNLLAGFINPSPVP